MQRILGLPDEQVAAFEDQVEAAVRAALVAVMEAIAHRVEANMPTTASSNVEHDKRVLVGSLPFGGNGFGILVGPQGTLVGAVEETSPPGEPGQPWVSPDDLASVPPLWQTAVEQQILPIAAQVFLSSVGKVHAGMVDASGIATLPSVGSLAAEQYLAQAKNTFDEVGDHLWAVARQQLSEGFEAGESIPQLAERLRSSAGITARTGVLVARTQVIEASNAGSFAVAQASGLTMKKEWIATPDLRTRPTHLAADGQRVDLNEPFIVGGYSAMYPAASTLPPSERYNCRCTMGYVMPDRAITQMRENLARVNEQEQLPGTEGPLTQIFPKPSGPGFDEPARGPDVAPGFVRPSLAAARTPKELRRVWQDEVETITGHPFLVDRMPTGISMVTAREYAEGVLQMFAQFPEAKVDRIHWFDDAASVSYAQVRRGGHAIEFNMRYASEAGRPRFLAARRKDAAGWDAGRGTSWGVRNDTTGQGVAYHEFTHILDIENARERIHGRIVPLLIQHAQREGITDIDDLIKRRISSYATENYQEMVAEAGADVMVNGAAASQLSRDIFDLLREEYRARGFGLRTGPTIAPGEVFPKAGEHETRAARLRALDDETPISTKRFDEGEGADAELLTYADGGQTVRKTFAGRLRSVDDEIAAEDLGAQVLDAFGLRAPVVVRTAGRADTVTMDVVEGRTGQSLGIDKHYDDLSDADFAQYVDTPSGHRMGIADYIMGNEDRNSGNWLIGEDGSLGGIDHAFAFRFNKDTLDSDNPFLRFLAGVNEYPRPLSNAIDFSRADLAAVRTRLEDLRPEFERLGKAGWHEQMMTRLGEVESRARAGGPVGEVFPRAAAPKPQTVGQLRAELKARGLTPAPGARKADLQRMLDEAPPPAAPNVLEDAARARQAIIDVRRASADALSEVAGLLDSGASARALTSRAEGIAGRVSGQAAKDLAPLVRAMKTGDEVKIRRAVTALQRKADLTPVGTPPPGQSWGAFDPSVHDVLPGLPRPAPGAYVRVTRPAYRAQVNGETVQLGKATVEPLDAAEVKAIQHAPAEAARRSGALPPEVAQRQAQLREDAARPVLPDKSRRMSGESAYTTKVEHQGGPPTITKDYTRTGETKAQAVRNADAEELGPLVDEAVGLRAPAVIRTGPRSVEQEFLDGGHLNDITVDAIDSDDGRLLGLADLLVGESDRHAENVIRMLDGRLASIDRGGAFRAPKLAGAHSPFAVETLTPGGKWAKVIDINPADLAVIRTRLEALRPEFERLGRATWHRQVMARLVEVEKRADPNAAIRLAEAVPDRARIISPVARDLRAYESRLSAARTGRAATKAPTVRFSVDADGADRVTGLDRLTLAERERVAVALDDYRGFEFSAINDMLRGVDADALRAKYGVGAVSAARGNRTFLDLAFEGSPLREDVIVWRAPGSGRGIFGDSATWGDDLAGFEWSDQAYSSTSASKAVSDRFMKDGGVRLRILAPKDTRSIHLAESGTEDELELLLDRDMQFRVVRDNGWKTVVHPETKSKIRIRDLDVEVVPRPVAPVDARAAQRAIVRERAAVIATQRGNAALIARVEELVQAKATKAVIRQELDPALREAEQLYAGADKAVADALRTAVDSGDAAKIRAALTRQSKASGLTPIGKAGAKAKFDSATMEGVGGTAIPDGADVIVVRRGAKLAGVETPEKATVRLARASSTEKTVAKGDFTGLTRTSEAMGGNPGGIFQASDGSRWYVKAAAGDAQARSEALALDLYRAAGLDAPEMVIGEGVEGLGQRQVATRFLDDAQVDLRARLANDPDYIAQVQDGFSVDAWLANWDVVGANPAAGWDNIVSVAGQPVRIEAGGALRYRGLGGTKPFDDTVAEFDTLRDTATARRAAQIFGDMTPEQLIASAERVRKVTPAKIKALVKKHGLDPELADTLIARREDILRRAEALAGPKPMTVREFNAAIESAKSGQAALDAVPIGRGIGGTGAKWRGPKLVDARDALDNYSGSDFESVNDSLRGLIADDTRQRRIGRSLVPAMDSAFERSALRSDIELWRSPGSGRRIFGDLGTWGDDLAGFEWSDSAYSSGSAVQEIATRFAKDGGIRLRMVVPKGSRAVQLSGISGSGEEAEILLARGARYRVVKDRGWTEITHPTGHQKIRVRDLDVEVTVPDETPPLPWATK